MKTILFYFSVVLALCCPTFSNAAAPKSAGEIAVVSQPSSSLLINSYCEKQYIDIDLLEDEDSNEIGTSTWKKFFSNKNESGYASMMLPGCALYGLQQINFNRFYVPKSSLRFIFLRVLRL